MRHRGAVAGHILISVPMNATVSQLLEQGSGDAQSPPPPVTIEVTEDAPVKTVWESLPDEGFLLKFAVAFGAALMATLVVKFLMTRPGLRAAVLARLATAGEDTYPLGGVGGREEQLRGLRCGVEAAMIMQYMRFNIKLFTPLAAWACLLLIPIYMQTPAPETSDLELREHGVPSGEMSGLHTMGLVHVPPGSVRLNVVWVSAYVLTIFYLLKLPGEWKELLSQRHAWFRHPGNHHSAVVLRCSSESELLTGQGVHERLMRIFPADALRTMVPLKNQRLGTFLRACFRRPKGLPMPPADPHDFQQDRRVGSNDAVFLLFFRSRLAASTCLSCGAKLFHLGITTETMPLDKYMFWEGMLLPRGVARWAGLLSWFLTACLFLFWTVPVAAVQSLATLDQLAKISGSESLGRFTSSFAGQMVEEVLPSMVLNIAIYLTLKSGIFQVLLRLANEPSHSGIQARSAALVMVFYTFIIFLGSTFAGALINHFADLNLDVRHALASQIPWGEDVWLQFLLDQFLVLFIIDLPQTLPLVVELVQRAYENLPSQLQKAPAMLTQSNERWCARFLLDSDILSMHQFLYGRLFMFSLLGLVHAIVCPVLVLPLLLIFMAFRSVWARLLLQVFTPPKGDTGGLIWMQAMRFTNYALIIGQLLLAGYLETHGALYGSLLVAPLPILTYFTEHAIRGHYTALANGLHLQLCVEAQSDDAVWAKATESSRESAPSLHKAPTISFADAMRQESLNPEEFWAEAGASAAPQQP